MKVKKSTSTDRMRAHQRRQPAKEKNSNYLRHQQIVRGLIKHANQPTSHRVEGQRDLQMSEREKEYVGDPIRFRLHPQTMPLMNY